jgi:hypothetical protein
MSRFRRIRTDTAYEKADREHNIAMAERLLSTGLADDFIIAFDILGWKLIPGARIAGRWPATARRSSVPSGP